MVKCDNCWNSRPIISENGRHYVCGLSHKAESNCMSGKKDRFVERKSKSTIGS